MLVIKDQWIFKISCVIGISAIGFRKWRKRVIFLKQKIKEGSGKREGIERESVENTKRTLGFKAFESLRFPYINV